MLGALDGKGRRWPQRHSGKDARSFGMVLGSADSPAPTLPHKLIGQQISDTNNFGAPPLRAAVLFECGSPLRILDDIEPPAPGRGQVFVELSHSGICHSQLMEMRGGRGPDRYLPHL